MDTLETPAARLTTTQKGAIGEAIVGAQLMLASGGRLSPFRSIADDDGTDLLLVDKVSGQLSMIQVKCRFRARVVGTKYEQFDVRLKTFREVAHNWVLAALIDPTDGALWCSWLLPASTLPAVAMRKSDKLVITPSPLPGSADRYVPWRFDTVTALAAMLMSAAAPVSTDAD
jgi:hypothetical protein